MPSRPDSTVKIFESSMAGAPVLSGTAGSLIAVLDACLCTGFGLKSVSSVTIASGVAVFTVPTGHSAIRDAVVEVAGVTSPAALNGQHKVVSITGQTVSVSVPDLVDQAVTGAVTMKLAGAGWEKLFAGTNKAVFRSLNNGATRLPFRFDDSGAQTAYVRGYESMTDIDTGTGLFPTSTMSATGAPIDKSSEASALARKWWVIANDRTVYVGIDHTGQTYSSACVHAFGDAVSRIINDQYRAFIAGGGGYPTYAYRLHSRPFYYGDYAGTPRCFARAYTGIGAAVTWCPESYGRAMAGGGFSGDGPRVFPNQSDNSVILDEVKMVESASGCLRAVLPGAYAVPQLVGQSVPDGTLFDVVAQLPGRRIQARVLAAPSDSAWGLACFDLSGPWAA